MQNDITLRADGWTNLVSGADTQTAPAKLPPTFFVLAGNVSARYGKPATRPAFRELDISVEALDEE